MSQQTVSESSPQIVVDTTALTQKLEQFETKMTNLVKEAVNPTPAPKALNEAASPTKEDYKQKLIEAMQAHKFIEWNEGVTSKKVMAEAIGALTSTSAVPDIWASEVERLHVYPNSVMLSTPGLVNWKSDITGKPGNKIEVPTVDKVVAVAVTDGTEPTISAATVSKVQITLNVIGASYYLTSSDIEDMVPGTIDALNAGLGSGIAQKLDTDFISYLNAPDGVTRGTLTTATLGSVAMSGSILARAMGSLRAGTYNPAFFLTHPQCIVSLMQNQAFYDASQFGNNEVTQRGAVASYYGVDIVSTPVIYSTGGTYKSYLVSKGALVGAIKRKPEIVSQYVIESGRTYVRADMRWGGTIAHFDGVFQVCTCD